MSANALCQPILDAQCYRVAQPPPAVHQQQQTLL